jgi:two-component system cell cycle sensor histidine kinase/response regulator CckA
MSAAEYTILIVEDSDVVRHLAHRILVRRGYWVLEAADADEALQLLATPTTPVDLILMDVVLPGTDGIELYAAICTGRANVPVLFMSAYPAEILAARGLPDLTTPFLAKPFTPDALLAKVRATIEARRGVGSEPSR